MFSDNNPYFGKKMDTLLVLQMCAIQQIGKFVKEINKMAQKI